jgi:hypothetical protein
MANPIIGATPSSTAQPVKQAPESTVIPKPRVFVLPFIKFKNILDYDSSIAIPAEIFNNPEIEYVTQNIEKLILDAKMSVMFLDEVKKKSIVTFEDERKTLYQGSSVQYYDMPKDVLKKENIAGIVEIYFRTYHDQVYDKTNGTYKYLNILEINMSVEDYRPNALLKTDVPGQEAKQVTHSYTRQLISLTDAEFTDEKLLQQKLAVWVKTNIEPELAHIFLDKPVAASAEIAKIQQEQNNQLEQLRKQIYVEVTQEYQATINRLNAKITEAQKQVEDAAGELSEVLALQQAKELLAKTIAAETDKRFAAARKDLLLRNQNRTVSWDISAALTGGIDIPTEKDPLFTAQSPLLAFKTEVGVTPYAKSADEKINYDVYTDVLKHTGVFGIAGSWMSSKPDYFNPANAYLRYETWDIQNYTVAGILGYRFDYYPLEAFIQVQPGVDITVYNGKTEFGAQESSTAGYFSLGGSVGVNWFLPIKNDSLKVLVGLTYSVKDQFRSAGDTNRLTQSLGLSVTLRNIFDVYK